MQPLISVIVPVYNVEKYLNKCIDSIVKQTYTNLEIILVDDGSTDKSPSICDEWANKDSRIKVIHKENGGLSSARNAGLDIMTGTLVGFVDGDDYILPEMYENLYNALIENDADLSICSYSRVDENDNPIPRKNKMKESIKVVSLNEILYVHRKHDKSVMGLLRKKKFDFKELSDRKFIAIDRYNYYMSINRPDLAKTAWKTAHFALAYTLKRVNYLEYKHEISPFLSQAICGLIKSCKFTYWLRALNLVRLTFCSLFRPFLHEEKK